MFYGRGKANNNKSKPTQAELKKQKSDGFAIGLISFALLYIGATFMAHMQATGGLDNADKALRTHLSWLVANPLPFHLTLDDYNLNCLIGGFILAMIPWIIYVLHLQKSGNYDPGKEHGDARWATKDEMAKIVDSELPSNNFMFTTHCGIVNKARDDMIAEWTSAKNKNTCVVGASGAGKSARVVKPRILASCGTALWPNGVNSLGLRDEGFDILLTDPKGDMLYDVGHALVNAGRTIKPFNTIFPRWSLHYNPLAYIQTRNIDAVKPADTKWSLSVAIDGKPALLEMSRGRIVSTRNMSGLDSLDWKGQPRMDRYSQRHAPAPEAWVCPDCGAVNSANAITCSDIDCPGRCPAPYPDDIRLQAIPVLKQTVKRSTAKELESVSEKALRIEHAEGMPSVTDFCASMNYTKSNITYALIVENYGLSAHAISIEVALDEHVNLACVNGSGSFDSDETPERYDEQGHRLIAWDIELCGMEAGKPSVAQLEIICHVEQMEVPDGVDLTKTANCLVNNLTQKTDKASDDPFWDNAFRLLLMGLIAYLFEVYDPKYRSLRWVMYLLNRAKVDAAGSNISPLDQMFDTWESGTVFSDEQDTDDPFAILKKGREYLCDAQSLEVLELDDDGTPFSVEGWAGPHDPDNDMALSCYKAFAQGAPETKQSILITAQTAFSSLLNEDMRELLDFDEMHLETIGDADQAQAIFLIGSDTDKTFAFLHALMMYQIINLTCDKALKKYRGSLPRHFRIIADEFANTGRLPDIDQTIAVVRSRNISIEIFLQSVLQLTRVYGEEAAEVIKDNCSTYEFLGGQSEKTLEGLEKMAGSETIDMWQLTRQMGQGANSEQRSSLERKLITMAQLRQLPDDEAIVQMTGLPPIKDKKINFGAYDFYEWIDPTREKRGCSSGERKFTEAFDVERYLEGVRAGEQPYNLRPDLLSKPASWAA